jgi:hypothetical protein
MSTTLQQLLLKWLNQLACPHHAQHAQLDPLLIGAHYDGPLHSIGADDNSTCVAVLLELAQRWSTTSHQMPAASPSRNLLVPAMRSLYGDNGVFIAVVYNASADLTLLQQARAMGKHGKTKVLPVPNAGAGQAFILNWCNLFLSFSAAIDAATDTTLFSLTYNSSKRKACDFNDSCSSCCQLQAWVDIILLAEQSKCAGQP